MLSTLRNQAGSIWAKLLLAFLVLTFGVWGIEDMLRHRGTSGYVAEVGGETITQAQLERAAEREMEAMKRVMGNNFSPELARAMGVHSQALNKMINSRLLVLEARRVGLRASDEDVANIIRNDNAFKGENGKFNKMQFQNLLRNANINELAYIDDVRRSLGEDLLTHSVEASAPKLVTDEAVNTLYAIRNEARTADLLLLPLSSVAEPAVPDEKTLTEYYQSHQRDYVQAEYRTISYITLKRDDFGKSDSVSEDAIKAAYAERAADYQKPEVRDVKQMLFPSQEAAAKAHELLKSGKGFDEAAAEAQAQNATGLSLGKVEKKTLPNEAQDVVFTLAQGAYSDPIQSPFGWHIFKVESVEAAHQIPLAQAREQIAKELSATGADDQLNDTATKIEDALSGGSTMEEAAKPFGLKIVTVGPIDAEGKLLNGNKAPNLPESDSFLKSTFRLEEKTDTTLTGKAGTSYIVHVETVQPEHVKPFADVKAQVTDAWVKDARAAKLSELAEANAAKLKAAPDALAATGAMGSTVSTGRIKRFSNETEGKQPLPPMLVEELFTLAPGKSTAAYAVGSDKYAIAVLRDVIPAPKPTDKDKAALDQIRQSLSRDVESELLQQYIASLRARYTVTVNDAVFEQMTAQPQTK